MEPDISKVLSYEIKKELADRYFGFRKLIEEDKQAFHREVRHCALTLEQKIGLDLALLYILLHDEDLIQRFLERTGLEEKIFYDPYLVESPTIRQRVLERVNPRGFTRRSRFVHLVLDGYKALERHVEQYRDQFGKLSEDLETIKEEIKIFYQKNDLGSIMSMLRNLDSCAVPGGSAFYGGVEPGSPEAFESKLKVEAPVPLEQQLPIVPPLTPYEEIRKELKDLAMQAFQRHGGKGDHRSP